MKAAAGIGGYFEPQYVGRLKSENAESDSYALRLVWIMINPNHMY